VTPEGPITVAVGQFGDVISRGLLEVLGDDRGLQVVEVGLDHAALELAVAHCDARVVVLDEDSVTTSSVSKRLCTARPSIGLVVLAHRPSRAYAVRMLAFGVTACLSTDAPAREILRAVRLAADGRHAFISMSPRPVQTRCMAGISALTQSERVVLALLSRGQKNAEIALALQVSIETIRTHVKHIYHKLGVSSRGELLGIEPSHLGTEHEQESPRQVEARPRLRSVPDATASRG
jgi:DNA-binding NarL/FixJ family response regulator